MVRSPESGQIDHGPQRTADQPLDLLRPAGDFPLGHFARRALRSRARQHRVFGRDPAFSATAQERRHAILHRSRAEHARIAHRDHHRAFGGHQVACLNLHRTHLVRTSPIDSHGQLDFNTAYTRNMVSRMIRMTTIRQGSPARGMLDDAFGLPPANLYLAIFHVVRRLVKKLVKRRNRPFAQVLQHDRHHRRALFPRAPAWWPGTAPCGSPPCSRPPQAVPASPNRARSRSTLPCPMIIS